MFAGGSSQSKGQTWFNLINSPRNRRLVLITVDYRPIYTYIYIHVRVIGYLFSGRRNDTPRVK